MTAFRTVDATGFGQRTPSVSLVYYDYNCDSGHRSREEEDELIPDTLFEIRYASDYNFVGAIIDGYKAPLAIMTEEAAQALKRANEELKQSGYVLLVYDAYRPTKAVDHFKRWAQEMSDTSMKDAFYQNRREDDHFKRRRS
ncbi:M15 family metallopeptidase [Cohnella sp.]|uniref:M15 family metallopeptidase n=1 Tax=Cohnella sp. TaxID=1883426 RepID=UPI003563CCAF